MLQKVLYTDLNARQKESYNFQKISAVLADYWFSTIRLSDDWQWADFIAQHKDGGIFLKVQLKWRFTVDNKYKGKNIWIWFIHEKQCYLYHHDDIVPVLLENFPDSIAKSQSWSIWESYSMGATKKLLQMLEPYKL